MLVRRGYGSFVAPLRHACALKTSVFTWFGEGHSRLVETKWSVASVFAVKHNGFARFSSLEPLCRPGCLLGASWVLPGCLPGASGCFLGAFWVPLGAFWVPGCLEAWMPGCLDAWVPGCLDALTVWIPGCVDAWMLKIDDLLVKNVQLHFFEFSSHQIDTILKSFALIFQSASI